MVIVIKFNDQVNRLKWILGCSNYRQETKTKAKNKSSNKQLKKWEMGDTDP